MIHEDEDRILEEWPEAKIITAKQDCEVGNHYHKIKTEKFILIKGIGQYIIGDTGWRWFVPGQLILVQPYLTHTFKLNKGSVLLGICSHAYDPTDDYTNPPTE